MESRRSLVAATHRVTRVAIRAAGTPTGVLDKHSKDIGRALATPDLRDWIAAHGGEPMSMTQPEVARFVQSESEGAARLSKAAGIKP